MTTAVAARTGVSVPVSWVDRTDHRMHAMFVAEGADRLWLELTAPQQAHNRLLHEALTDAGWGVPVTALMVPEPATEIRHDADGYVEDWAGQDLFYDAVTVPYAPLDTSGRPVKATGRDMRKVRNILRFFGMPQVPVTRRTWRNLI